MFRSSREGPTEEKAGRHTPIRLGTALIATVGMLLGPLAIAASAASAPHAASTVQGSYVPLTPFRILDTRTGSPIAAASWLNLQVTGVGTTPVPAGAAAVVMNVTVVNPAHSGFLSVLPASSTTAPTISDLNFKMGETVANLVTAPLSATGGVSVYNSSSMPTDIVVDVSGYYTSTLGTTGLYNTVTPYRALGSLAEGATVQANTSVPVTVTGVDGIPTTATAVVANVTAAAGTDPSFLTVYPAGATLPVSSNLNFATDEVVANRVTVGVGTGGVIEVYNHSGTVSVDVDLVGYYASTGAYFVPITPVRVADTRAASAASTGVIGTGTAINPASSEVFQIATATSGIPSGAAAVIGNFTVVAGDAPGYLTVYPTSAATNPVASDVNWVANGIVPNFIVAPTNGTGSVEVYASHGAAVNLVIDVFGYFQNSTPTMVSAVVSATSIAITYNEAVTCPTSLTGALAFTYDWTGSANGGTLGACTGGAATTTPDVLMFAGNFTLPGSTGGSITYAVPALAANAVFATGSNPVVYELAQTLGIPAVLTVPAMVSALQTGSTLLITYNEAVSCPTVSGTVNAYSDFVYTYTGVATDPVVGCSPTSTNNVLTLGLQFADPPAPGILVYTAPATNSTSTSIYATGSASPTLYAATQTLSGSMWTTPAMTAAVVNSATQLAVTYNEAVSCPATGADADFVYDSSTGVSGGAITGCANNTATQLFLSGVGLTLPTSTASLVYTAPASPVSGGSGNAVYATSDFPQFPLTQTEAVTVPVAPVMQSVAVTAGLNGTVAITYNGNVSCVTAVASDFAYYSSGTTSGLGAGTITAACAGAVLTITDTGGTVVAPVGTTASVVYTAPASSTSANAVYAAGTSVFAATQTLALTGTPAMVSAVVTNGSIAVTYGQPVSCPTTFTNDWTYYSVTLPADQLGGMVTGCTASGDVLTLTATGGFNAPQGTASLTYTSPAGANPVNAVFATGTTVVAATQVLPGSAITA
ncbi:MAG: beta strand repeat-containing protein [Acidimicrobiales bacterium]